VRNPLLRIGKYVYSVHADYVVYRKRQLERTLTSLDAPVAHEKASLTFSTLFAQVRVLYTYK
jgi:hypothetical protein